MTTNTPAEPTSHPLDRFAVEGKSAVITGASGEIRAGIVETLGVMGAKFTLVFGSADKLRILALKAPTTGTSDD